MLRINKQLRRGLLTFFLYSVVAFSRGAVAQTRTNVRLDGTLNSKVGKLPKLIGSEYLIDDSLGKLSKSGHALLFSFSKFDVGTNASVRFSLPRAIKSVLARVTGGSSIIDGAIRSDSQADLFFMNPAGIAFARNAKLELNGSFTATTADLVRLPNGDELQARSTNQSVLRVAPQATFGFSGKPAAIKLDDCHLSVSRERNVALVGGDVQFRNASIDGQEPMRILRAGEPHTPSESSVRPSALFIRGHDMVIEGANGSITGKSTNYQPGEDVDIALDGNLTITNNGRIDVSTTKDQDAGNVFIKLGGDLLINNGGIKAANSKREALGFAGNVEIHAATVTMENGGSINTSSRGGDPHIGLPADAGNVSIYAGHLTLRKNATIDSNVRSGFGNAGNIRLHANQLIVSDNSQIVSEGLGAGLAGAISVSGLDTKNAQSIVMNSGAVVSIHAGSDSAGAFGNVTLNADSIQISGASTRITTIGFQPVPKEFRTGGNIDISARDLQIDNQAQIDARNLIRDAGEINIRCDVLHLSNAALTTEAPFGNGGNISLSANRLLFIHGGEVTSNAGSGISDPTITSGDITAGQGLVVLESVAISANSSGPAGNIRISTRGLLKTDDTKLSAVSSQVRLDGTVAVTGPENNLAGLLVDLPAKLQSAPAHLHECCQLKLTRSLSSFVQKGVGGVPLDLGGWTPVSDLQSPKKDK